MARQGQVNVTAGNRSEQPYLIVITGRSAGRMFPLRDDESVIGRSADDATIAAAFGDSESARTGHFQGYRHVCGMGGALQL